MGRIVDIIKAQLFWVVTGLVVAAIACGYFLLVVPEQKDIAKARSESRDNMNTLRKWEKAKSIPNAGMIEAAGAERKRVESQFGQLLLSFSERSGGYNKDFDSVVRGAGRFDTTEAYEWWNEYERKTDALNRDLQAHEGFRATATVLEFARKPTSPDTDLQRVRQLQRNYWISAAIVSLLKQASPNEAPLVEALDKITLSGAAGGTLSHPWLRTVPFTVLARIRYENVPDLLAALQNSATPVQLSGYKLTRPRDPAPAGGLLLGIELHCELIEFLPTVHTVTFSKALFEDAARVRQWLADEKRALCRAAAALMGELPVLRARGEERVGRTLDMFRAKARKEMEDKLAAARAAAAKRLQEQLDGFGEEGPTAEQHTRIESENKRELEQELKGIRQIVASPELDFAEAAGGLALARPHLYPLLPQRAYYVGVNPANRDVVIVRAPFDQHDWYLARYAEPVRGKPLGTALQELAAALQKKLPGRQFARGVVVDPSDPNRVRLVVDRADRKVVKVVIGEPKGSDWRVFDVIQADGAAVAVSDAAFRFPTVIADAARRANTVDVSGKEPRITVTPAGELQQAEFKRFEFTVEKDGKTGNVNVLVKLRK